jgi:hypothetical protein
MRRRRSITLVLVVLAALALAACGSSSKKSKSSTTSKPAVQPTTLSLSISESGKKAQYSAPSSTKGGVVTVSFHNGGKKPHAAQLVRLTGNHSPAEIMKGFTAKKGPPSWIHLTGGVATTPPGQTGSATVNLEPGNYLVLDIGGPGGGSGPPAHAMLKVAPGSSGSLPSTPTTVTATAPAKDKYKWDVSGALKPGDNRLTFVSKGRHDAVHLIAAFRLKGKASDAQIKKSLTSNGKPPAFVDQSSFQGTTVLDAGRSEVTSLTLAKPGEYVLFCPLKDRDGGKPHDQEGLLTRVTVK